MDYKNTIIDWEKRIAALEVQFQEQQNKLSIHDDITMKSTFDYKGPCPILKAYDSDEAKK